MAQLQHPEYPLVSEAEADGIAYAFNAPNTDAVRYPFKFPPIKPNEIRIKQSYFGLCYSDCHLVNQDWFDVKYPIVPGHEILGRVTLLGSEVKNFKVGDLVGYGFIRDSCGACELCFTGDDQLCQSVGDNKMMPLPHFGGFATHVQAPAKWAFPIPNTIPEEVCAPLLCAGVTLFAPLKKHGRPGYECAIIGIGGLGHLGIKIAAAMGMKVTVFSTTASKKDEAFSYGATNFVLQTDPEEIKKNQGKFDLVVNCSYTRNSEAMNQLLSLVKFGGEMVLIGIAQKDSDFGVDINSLVNQQKCMVGSLVGSRIDTFEMLEFVAKHKLYPVVEVFPFAEFNKAYQHILKGTPRYRCVVKI